MDNLNSMSTSHWNTCDFSVSKRARNDTSYTFSSLPKDESAVPEENTPDLLQLTSDQPTQSKTLMVAETEFFNQRNQDYWQRSDLSHLRPYDFPYVRALVHLLEEVAEGHLRHEDVLRRRGARARAHSAC